MATKKRFLWARDGQMTDDEYVTKFLKLLRYVSYPRYEKAKIQSFINGLPMIFRDQIELLEPKTLNDVINKLKYCYE